MEQLGSYVSYKGTEQKKFRLVKTFSGRQASSERLLDRHLLRQVSVLFLCTEEME